MEDEIRWRPWSWLYGRVEKIFRDKRAEHRFQLEALLASLMAVNGEEGFAEWQKLFHSQFSKKELEEIQRAEQARLEAELAAQKQAKFEEWVRQHEARGGDVFVQSGGGRTR